MASELVAKFGKQSVGISRVLLLLLLALLMPVSVAEEIQTNSGETKQKLPDPLALEYLLDLDVNDHPILQRASAAIELQNANKEFAVSDYGFTANLLLEARAIEPNRIAFDQDQNDSQIHLYLNKRLYDFGKTSAAEDAAVADVEGSELLYVNAYTQHRIAIMSRFFAVLLADLTYDRDNEAMSIGYVRFDRGRHRNNLGQMSDVELLKLENRFQLLRRAYYKSQAERRNSRSRLANIVNRPGELVSNLVIPELQVPLGNIPELEKLQKNAIANNPVIKALRLKIAAAEDRVKAARSERNPKLDGRIRVSEYARESGSYDEWRVGLVLDVPIFASDSVKANVSKRNAELLDMRARLRDVEMQVNQQVLEAWQMLESLKVAREQTVVQSDYRELYLDQSRTLYEMEVQSDLGDSMVQITEAKLQKAEVEYQLALEWAKLQALMGQQVNVLQEQKNDAAK